MTLLNQVASQGKQILSQGHQTEVYTYGDSKIPLLHSQSLNGLVKTIKNHHKYQDYISILMCGQSGSGKSTYTQSIIHKLSCMSKEPYIVKWFSRNDIQQLDNIIDSLEKGLRYIIIFDDVSFVMDFLPSKRKKELAEKLTHIRHDLEGAKVISFMNIHYQKALMPMLRDSNYRVITSMSDQDAANWKNTLGWNNRFVIDKYQKQYYSMMQKGYWYVNGVKQAGSKHEAYAYQTNEPFRIALVSTGKDVKPMLFPKLECGKCSISESELIGTVDAKYFVKQCLKGYKTSSKTGLRYYMYFVHGRKDCLPDMARHGIEKIEKTFKKYRVDDFDDLVDEVKQTIGQKRDQRYDINRKHGSRLHKSKLIKEDDGSIMGSDGWNKEAERLQKEDDDIMYNAPTNLKDNNSLG